jgi:hypothetical protein
MPLGNLRLIVYQLEQNDSVNSGLASLLTPIRYRVEIVPPDIYESSAT